MGGKSALSTVELVPEQQQNQLQVAITFIQNYAIIKK